VANFLAVAETALPFLLAIVKEITKDTYRIPPYLKIPDQSTNHIANSTEPVEVLVYRHAKCLVIGASFF
jgi:hypothetical protein